MKRESFESKAAAIKAGLDANAEAIALGATLASHLQAQTDDTPAFVDAAYARLLALDEQASDREALGKGFLDCAQILFHRGTPLAALEPAEKALSCARQTGDPKQIRLALSVKAVVLGDLSDLPGANACLAEALDLAEKASDRRGECSVWNQLGLTLLSQSLAGEAVSSFERELEIADQDAKLVAFRAAALSNIGMACIDTGETDRGIRAVNAAIALSGVPATPVGMDQRVRMEVTLSRLLVNAGNQANAKEHAATAQRYAEASGFERSKLLAAMAQGLAECAGGAHDIGLTRLRSSVDVARHAIKSLQGPALHMLIKAYEIVGQNNVARVYLEELMRLNKETKTANLIAQHRRQVEAVVRRSDTGDVVQQSLEQQRLSLQGGNWKTNLRNLTRLAESHAVAAELHDDTTGEHCFRVGRLAAILAKEIGLDEQTCFLLDLAARMHDVGKLFVPDAILNKPGRLTDEERRIMQTHTTSGAEYLQQLNIPEMHIAQEIARHHHERWDGTGYPDRLEGSAIPIAARVAALSDVYDALTHVRPYKRAWTQQEALDEIRLLRGKAFDPDLTVVFLELVPRLTKQVGNLDAFLAEDAKKNDFVLDREKIAQRLKGTDPSVTAFELRR